MPITPTTTVDPNQMLTAWKAGLQSSAAQQKLLYKYTHPKRAFNADPQGSQNSYQTGVARAISANKYASGMAAADTNKAADNMQQFGITNWANAATAKAYKYQAVAQNLAQAINSTLTTVNAMPKGKGANAKARMNAWFDGMSSYYGKIKS